MVQDHFISLFFSLALGWGAFFFASRNGFFRLPYSSWDSPAVSLKRVIIVFALYVLISLFAVAIIIDIFMRIVSRETVNMQTLSPEFHGWFNIATIILASLVLLIYALAVDRKGSEIWWWGKRKSFSAHFKDAGIGIATWVVSMPFVAIVGHLCALVLLFFIGEVDGEQVAVKQIKNLADSPILYKTMILLVILVVPIVEEVLFRGYLQGFLRTILGRKKAIVLSAIVFTLFHFSPSQGAKNLELLGSLFVLACFLGFLYERQRSLIAPIALHATFNAISTMMISFVT